jgi:hypothetical protein
MAYSIACCFLPDAFFTSYRALSLCACGDKLFYRFKSRQCKMLPDESLKGQVYS